MRRLPAEFEPHAGTVICWPERHALWGEHFEEACRAHAMVANTIAEFEPVTVIAAPTAASAARAVVASGIDVLELPLDDSWVRDTGPIWVDDGDELVATDWTFNGWGDKYHPYHDDALLARRLASAFGHRTETVEFVLEGGAITTDGDGTLITTVQCLLQPNRNPLASRQHIESMLIEHLGIRQIEWLPYGLVDDHDTDGHVDNVAAFARPGVVIVQGCDDTDRPDHDRLAANRRWLAERCDAAGRSIEIVEVPILPRVTVAGVEVDVPYLNFYIGNGFVVVPVCGHRADAEMCALIAEQFPGRQTIPLDIGAVLAHGGGGIHCITGQIPRGPDRSERRSP